MIKFIFIMMVVLLSFANSDALKVASFKGEQVTGVTVTKGGEIFVNFPRWRDGIKYSVARVENDKVSAYPDMVANSYKSGDKIDYKKFVSVQSVVAHDGKLYVLDTANPGFKGLISKPRLYVYNLKMNKLVKMYTFGKNVTTKMSYLNDLRFYKNKIYMTDSGTGGIVILDTKSGKSKRVLNKSKYTLAQTDRLMIDGKVWKNTIHSDGIALDAKNKVLYIHALTSHMMYGFRLKDLNKSNPKPIFSHKTSAPDGMIYHKGYVYYGDLENHAINKINVKTKKESVFYKNKNIVKWSDTFSIYDGYLYFTNSRIDEIISPSGIKKDVSKMVFTLYKVKLK